MIVLLLVACAAPVDARVLTYNVHGLPPEITGDDTVARMEAIGPLLAGYDVVGLQEVFLDDGWQRLVAGAPQLGALRDPERLDPTRAYGSGLAVLSDATLVDWEQTFFETCNGWTDGASDCLASKGYVRVGLRLGRIEVDVFDSHLEAGNGDDDDAVRASQVDRLISAMNEATRPVVFLGDTNLDAGDPRDAAHLDRWLAEADLRDACAEVGCAEPDHIDRVFVRDGDRATIEVLDWSADEPVAADGGELSDHPRVAATLRVSP